MKSILHRLSLAFAVLVLIAATAAAASPTYRLVVDGLVCPLCAYSVRRNLSAIEGVETIEIDYRTGQAVVAVAEGATLDEAEAREAIERAGFELRVFEERQGSPQE